MKLFSTKLIMCTCLVMSVVGVADAAQLIVFEAPRDGWHQEISADFEVNRELGRAWINVAVTTDDVGEGVPTRRVVSRAVEGLYYDQGRKEVLYRTAGEPIVCAEDARFFWGTYLKNTGQCLLTAVLEKRKTDDGFNPGEETVAKVLFEVRTPPAPQHAGSHAAGREGMAGQ